MKALVTKRLLAAAAVAFALYVAVGLALRLTVKDTIPFVSVFYYAAPLPVLTFAAPVAGFLWLRLKKPGRAWLLLAIGFLCAWWTMQTLYFTNSSEPESAQRCVVFWNVSSCDLGWSGVVATLKSQSPDVIGIVEIGGEDSKAAERWREAFPGYQLTDAVGSMLLLSKDEIIHETFGSFDTRGKYKKVTIDTDDGLLNVLIVDIESNPLMYRREPLEQLAAIAAKLDDQPTLVLGDFNTPGDSVHFDVLRRTFVNAFESRGNGYAATWPIPFPVLQLDHIWANRRIAVSRCEAGWTFRSDHRPLTAFVSLTPPG